MVTYILEVYNALQSRNTFALKLHLATAGTGDASEMLARLGMEGRFDVGYTQLAEFAAELAHLKESMHFYPVSLYFRFEDDHYAVPRVLAVVLDATAVCQCALEPRRYRWLTESAAMIQLQQAAELTLERLTEDFLPAHRPTIEFRDSAWADHFRRATERLARAGIATVTDVAGASQQYLTLRRRWQQHLDAVSRHLGYNGSAITGPAA